MTPAQQALFLDRLRPGDAVSVQLGDRWLPSTFVAYAVDTLALSTAQGTVHLDMWAGRQLVGIPSVWGLRVTMAEGDWGRIAPPF